MIFLNLANILALLMCMQFLNFFYEKQLSAYILLNESYHLKKSSLICSTPNIELNNLATIYMLGVKLPCLIPRLDHAAPGRGYNDITPAICMLFDERTKSKPLLEGLQCS